jgi:hypothetical protein
MITTRAHTSWMDGQCRRSPSAKQRAIEIASSASIGEESLLKFEKGKALVELEVRPQHFETRQVSLGVSDGVHVEVLSGLDRAARIKRQELGNPASYGK